MYIKPSEPTANSPQLILQFKKKRGGSLGLLAHWGQGFVLV
jgi:hypothetical protein